MYFRLAEWYIMSAFDRLITQIDAFIRKFYKNQIIKGLLLFIGVLVVSYLFVITLEYFGRFNSIIRGLLLFGFISVNTIILSKYIIIPTLKLKEFGNRINRYQASKIIGRFFPQVSDRLLNTLQLKDQMNQNSADYELLYASVQQRSATMSIVPFSDAIDIGENKKHLKWVLPVVLVLFFIAVFSPSFLTQGTERVINFSEVYAVKAPFEFSLVEKSLSVEEGDDYKVEVELLGRDIPDKVYIKSKQGRFLLNRVTKNRFQGSMVQVRMDLNFHFEANEFESKTYLLSVISKTAIGKFQATLVYPSYLGKESEKIENSGDLIIYEGTSVSWSVRTKNSQGAEFWIDKNKKKFNREGFTVHRKFVSNANGMVVLTNRQSAKKDTTRFVVEVIKDEYPSIQVGEINDTIKDGIRYFSGMIGDDHGLRSLKFVYSITGKEGKKRTEKMDVRKVAGTESPFDFAVDFRREKLKLDDRIEYYFVVYDNDGVNGSKATKSRVFQYHLPNLEELNELREEEQEKAKDDLNDALKKAAKFKEDLDRLRKETLNSQQSNWNKENQVKQLQEDHEALLKNLQEIKEEMNNSVQEKNQLSEIDEELLKQQEMINELLDELMDDELRDLLKQLEELMKEQNKNALEKNMDQLEMSSEEMKKQLDRSLEMLKKLQVNEKIDAIEEELKKLAAQQEKLRQKGEKNKGVNKDNVKEQNKVNKKFEDVKTDLKELDSLNNALNRPMQLGSPEEQGDEIQQDLEESKERLEKGKNGKAGESQKGASEKMEQLAEQLDAMQAQSNEQQQGEDMDLLRDILESLVSLSFTQEDVMKKFKRVSPKDPAYRKYGRDQRRIIDDTKVVRDSLYALAKRQPMIAKFIDKELNQIETNHDIILEQVDERKSKQLRVHQQYVMTSYNNLALMLDESLQEMQKQMQSMMEGSGNCSKPGGKGKPSSGKKPSPGDMKEMLKKQLEQMKNGKKPGGKTPGETPGSNPNGEKQGMGLSNRETAKMAAQQSLIRKRLEQLRNELNKEGRGRGNKLNPLIDELEKQERDLVNKKLNDNMIERQNRILTRLLESEKALLERGIDEKRESNEGKSENYGNQIRFNEYNKEKLKQIELLRSVDPSYKKYYKDRANEYFNRVL